MESCALYKFKKLSFIFTKIYFFYSNFAKNIFFLLEIQLFQRQIVNFHLFSNNL